jgi:DeoR/GlpR family transcriptional regulator of sugar metabolism
MIAADRRRQIVRTVNESGKISVSEISDMFNVSDMTARRDLRTLDQEGLLRRVYGGAVSRLGRSYEPPFPARSEEFSKAKKLIGIAAASLVVDGDSLALDVGTTTLEVARGLRGLHNLTIITASLPIANEIVSLFSLEDEIRLILTGGIVRPVELSMIGHLAQRTLSELHVDKAFIGVGGINAEHGLTEYNIDDTMVKRPLIRTAKRRIVVADSSKLGRTTFAKIVGIDQVDALVTDSGAPTGILDELRARDIEIIVAEPERLEGGNEEHNSNDHRGDG